MDAYTRAIINGDDVSDWKFKGQIDTMPEEFNQWVRNNRERIANAKTQPYFIRDNQKAVEEILKGKEGDKANENTESKEARYAANRKTYEKLRADTNYKDVAFDEASGGVKATHIEHNFDHLKGHYEKSVQKVGYRNGHAVIFGDEPQNIYKKKSTEGTWDNLSLEIGSAENGTPNNVRNALKHCAKKPDCDVAVIYFPNNYSKGMFEDGLGKFMGLAGTEQFHKFKRIICIHKDAIINEINQP